VVGIFGGSCERDVYLLLCEVFGLEERDTLLDGCAGNRWVLENYVTC